MQKKQRKIIFKASFFFGAKVCVLIHYDRDRAHRERWKKAFPFGMCCVSFMNGLNYFFWILFIFRLVFAFVDLWIGFFSSSFELLWHILFVIFRI